jgi:formate hydrogenlyase subunit 3/multisubunit Na+/H+ antiporter MnhD subunit
MDKAKDIKEELLKQMDGYSVEKTELISTSARKIIDKHKIQLRRRKRIAAIGWLITFLYAVGMHNLKVYVSKYNIEDVLTRQEFWFIRFSDMALIVVILISILLTFLVYAKSRKLTMLQICARLTSIEEQLKKISQNT